MIEKKIVLPGDELGASEEFIGGPGTYEKNGKIISTQVGMPKLNFSEMMVTVKPVTSTPVVLEVGDEVICTITELRESMALVDILRVIGKNREIACTAVGSIHISKVSEEYVVEVGRAFRVGDIIRAKVIQTSPSIQLSTVGASMGVLKSVCMKCREPLVRKKNDLYCPVCERYWQKKMAADYGKGCIDL
jgi:exosome complex component CSL4